MKRNLARPTGLVPQGPRFMTQPTGGDGSAADTGAGSNPPATGDNGSSGTGNTQGGDGGSNGSSQSSGSSQSQENTSGGRGDGNDSKSGDKIKIEDLPESMQAYVRELRKENGDYRTAKKNAEDAAAQASEQAKSELVQELGKALGLVDSEDSGDKAPSAEELTQQITSEREAHKATKVELAVYRSASKHEADPDALLDSRAFLEEAVKLDPSSDEFGSKISDVIKSAVDKNPKLKLAGQTPGRSGGQVNGGGSVTEGTSDELASRIRKARNY